MIGTSALLWIWRCLLSLASNREHGISCVAGRSKNNWRVLYSGKITGFGISQLRAKGLLLTSPADTTQWEGNCPGEKSQNKEKLANHSQKQSLLNPRCTKPRRSPQHTDFFFFFLLKNYQIILTCFLQIPVCKHKDIKSFTQYIYISLHFWTRGLLTGPLRLFHSWQTDSGSTRWIWENPTAPQNLGLDWNC